MHIKSLKGGNYATHIDLTGIFRLAKSASRLDKVNLRNAGNTKFDECNVLAAYIRGFANKGARLVGYSTISGNHHQNFKKRLLGANIDTIHRIHKLMKIRKLVPAMKTQRGGHYPFFYVVERLLQIKCPNYDAMIPEHLENWFPPEHSIYNKWFREE
jgi:hypothetical protein